MTEQPMGLGPRVQRFRADVTNDEKEGMDMFERAHTRVSTLFPNNTEAQEALMEIISAEWCRLRYGA